MRKPTTLIVSNNPRIRSFHEELPEPRRAGIDLIFCSSRDEVFIKVRDLVHQGWELVNHPMSGNIPAHKHPYRSMALRKTSELKLESLALWEAASERVRRGPLPDYPPEILADFQELDRILFAENLKL